MRSINRPNQNAVYKKIEKSHTNFSGFSPMLSTLLSFALKDGFCNNTAFALLRDISPYVSASDRAQINKILKISDSASYVVSPQKCTHTFRDCGMRAPLCNTDKTLGLMRVLMRYGGQNTRQIFEPIIRAINMQCRIKNIPNNPMSMLCEFMPQLSGMMGNLNAMKNVMGNAGDMSSILNMMNSMNKG